MKANFIPQSMKNIHKYVIFACLFVLMLFILHNFITRPDFSRYGMGVPTNSPQSSVPPEQNVVPIHSPILKEKQELTTFSTADFSIQYDQKVFKVFEYGYIPPNGNKIFILGTQSAVQTNKAHPGYINGKGILQTLFIEQIQKAKGGIETHNPPTSPKYALGDFTDLTVPTSLSDTIRLFRNKFRHDNDEPLPPQEQKHVYGLCGTNNTLTFDHNASLELSGITPLTPAHSRRYIFAESKNHYWIISFPLEEQQKFDDVLKMFCAK